MDVEFLKYKYQDGCEGVIVETKFRVGVRHVQVVYMFACGAVLGALRGSVGLAVLAITDTSRRNDTYIQIQEWDRRVQGSVLSSFLFGYALAMLPAELYLRRLGDKFVITSVLLVNGALTAATPTIVNRGGWAALCNAHFLMGMTQSCLSPINRVLLSNWLPPVERRAFGCFIDGGVYLGMVAALPAAGRLAEGRLGWELACYWQAGSALAMAALWALLTAASPGAHPALGEGEKEYIEEASAGYRKKKLQIPWRCMVASRQVIAVALAHAAANALFTFYLVDVPCYLKSTGHSLRESGLQAMSSFIALYVLYAATATVRWLLSSSWTRLPLNVTRSRKAVNALGALPIVVGLAIQPHIAAEWTYLRLCVLIGTLGLLGVQYSGFLENIRDLSEDYCGTLFVLSSAVGSAVGATVPLFTGIILRNEEKDPRLWRIVFCSLSGLYASCNIAYSVLGGSERARWACPARPPCRRLSCHSAAPASEQASSAVRSDHRSRCLAKCDLVAT